MKRARRTLVLWAASLGLDLGLNLGLGASLNLSVGVGEAAARPLSALDLVNLEQVASPRLSPDGRWVIYDVRTTDYPENKYTHAIWLAGASGSVPPRRLAAAAAGGTDPRWSSDGRSIYFLSSRSGSQQVWKTDATGVAAAQVTALPLPVGVFKLAPDGQHIVVSLAVFTDCVGLECTVERQKTVAAARSTGQVFDRLFVRQDYEWENGTRNHLFSIRLGATGVAEGPPTSLMRQFDGDCPTRVWASDDAFDISADGGTVFFSAKVAGRTEAWSDNTDIWRVPIDGTAAPVDLTTANPAADVGPVASPDGRYLAYRAQTDASRPLAGRYHIEIADLRDGTRRELAATWTLAPLDIAWSRDGHSLVVDAEVEAGNRLFRIDLKSGAVTALVTGAGSSRDYSLSRNGFAYVRSEFTRPPQIYVGDDRGRDVQLTHQAEQALADIRLVVPEPFSFSGWDGETVHGFVFKPYDYQPGHRYPAVLLIHGGPHEAFDSVWSTRWNPQTLAGAGFCVVMINAHGSTGYGEAFTDSVNGHWGDRPLEDLQRGWDAARTQFPSIDSSRACALGASFGGYMVDWIAGSWKSPWRCLVSHDGIFDTRAFAYTSDAVRFAQGSLAEGHPVFERPDRYEQFNPVDRVAGWSTPMLIVHGGNDYRVPLEQSIAAFTALQLRGIPSRFLYFPDEIHAVMKPQNIVQWTQAIEAWVRQWTAP